MNRRILSVTIAATMLAGCLFGCQEPAEEPIAPGISAVTTDATAYAEWLTDRLDEVSDSISLGIGSDEKYKVDMTEFEDDGYVLRRDGERVVIFGKTDDGLDRGVRKYANLIDANETFENIEYHKGARIEALKIFGTDISEFVINYPDSFNANMEFAGSELQMLVKKATGVELPIVVGASDAAKKIELRHTTDESFKENGYRYFDENGNLVIEGAIDRGCSNGVYRFLQIECGWDGLIYGDSYLQEADLIDIPAGLNKSEVPIMEYLHTHANFGEPTPELTAYVTDRTEIERESEYNSYGPHDQASHGMHKWHPLVDSGTGGWQLCYSDEANYQTVLKNIIAHIEEHEAAGGKAGVTLKDIDISQGDNNRYCLCVPCNTVSRLEENSFAGPLLRFANRLAEELNEKYDNIGVHIFAYFASKKPPEKTKAHDMVYVTFAQNGNCSNHSLYGEECAEVTYKNIYSVFVHDSNKLNDEFLSGWCDIAKNVNVWYYAMDTVFHQYTILDVLHRDFQYIEEHGIRGMFFHIDYHGFGVKRVEQQLANELNWLGNITDEEYEARLCDLLKREYGSGWKYIREYIDYMIEATDRFGCFNCWGYGTNRDPEYDWKYMKDNYMTMVDLLEKAARMADSEKQESMCKLLYTSTYYSGVFSNYFTAYEAEDAATIAKLNEQYDYVYDLIVEFGYDPEGFADSKYCKMYPTLEEEAWNEWIGQREIQVGSENLRPAPDWYIEQQATATEAA